MMTNRIRRAGYCSARGSSSAAEQFTRNKPVGGSSPLSGSGPQTARGRRSGGSPPPHAANAASAAVTRRRSMHTVTLSHSRYDVGPKLTKKRWGLLS